MSFDERPELDLTTSRCPTRSLERHICHRWWGLRCLVGPTSFVRPHIDELLITHTRYRQGSQCLVRLIRPPSWPPNRASHYGLRIGYVDVRDVLSRSHDRVEQDLFQNHSEQDLGPVTRERRASCTVQAVNISTRSEPAACLTRCPTSKTLRSRIRSH